MSMALAQSVATLRAISDKHQAALDGVLAALTQLEAERERLSAELATLRTTVAQVAVSKQAPRKEAASGQGT